MVAVSVVMPVLNGEKYLSDAVESILTQTFSDFEFWALDDGSTDSTLSILKAYAAKDKRLRVLSRENRGLVSSLNELLGHAQGRFVARMDGDDISLPHRFARQVQFLQHYEDVVCVGGHVDLIDEQGQFLKRFEYPKNDEEIQAGALTGRATMCHPCFMMRRDVVVGIGGYDGSCFPAEDLDLWLRLGEVGKLANLGEVLLKYRMHFNSVSEQGGRKQREAIRAVCERAWKRRGLRGTFEDAIAYMPEPDEASRHRLMLKYGWLAYSNRHRRTAVVYGLRAVKERPMASNGWRLLVCALCKPFRAAERPISE